MLHIVFTVFLIITIYHAIPGVNWMNSGPVRAASVSINTKTPLSMQYILKVILFPWILSTWLCNCILSFGGDLDIKDKATEFVLILCHSLYRVFSSALQIYKLVGNRAENKYQGSNSFFHLSFSLFNKN